MGTDSQLPCHIAGAAIMYLVCLVVYGNQVALKVDIYGRVPDAITLWGLGI